MRVDINLETARDCSEEAIREMQETFSAMLEDAQSALVRARALYGDKAHVAVDGPESSIPYALHISDERWTGGSLCVVGDTWDEVFAEAAAKLMVGPEPARRAPNRWKKAETVV